jgi:hypothetical protein
MCKMEGNGGDVQNLDQIPAPFGKFPANVEPAVWWPHII